MSELNIISAVLGPVSTNCYTLANVQTKDAVIIDPADSGKHLVAMIEDQVLIPRAFLLTHGHFDHCMGVPELKEAYPDVPVIIGEKDAAYLENPELNLAGLFIDSDFTLKADRTVKDGEILEFMGTKIQCIEVPGHTPGGMCYYFPEQNLLFDGDTLFAGSIGRTDFPGGSHDALISGIEKKLFTLPEETLVFPGHDRATTIKKEIAVNMYF
ncbi:MAG: MBL fold metallo-hydrolase [Eubacterium sp.]|nr:MBL fold metallo-hydrolase [Eubacterium sp.]